MRAPRFSGALAGRAGSVVFWVRARRVFRTPRRETTVPLYFAPFLTRELAKIAPITGGPMWRFPGAFQVRIICSPMWRNRPLSENPVSREFN